MSPSSIANPIRCILLTLLLPAAFLLQPPSAAAKSKAQPEHWVGTWATANWDENNGKLHLGEQDITLREIVHPTLAGALVRVEVTNEFGTEPLTIGAAHIALAGEKGAITLSSAQALTFNGTDSITIPPGAVVLSDPAALKVSAGTDLAVSIFLPAQTITHLSRHSDAYTTNFEADGNQVGHSSLHEPRTNTAWCFLKAVDVQAPGEDGAVVAFGDSITDGTGSTTDAHNRWVDVLAARLQSDKHTSGLAVLNEGIGGNRVLNTGNGPSALTRFNSDVLALPGVRYLVILESINDIGHLKDELHPGQKITAEELIQGLTQMVERAHAHGIKVILATLTPYQGASDSTAEGEAIRTQVNDWIRSYKYSDGVVDFDAATRDGTDPHRFNQSYQIGDQLHPSPAGYKVMGDAFDLKLFRSDK